MKSRVKTGDIFQIRKNGPNYITVGKVTDRYGNELIAATKNGNIDYSGNMKKRTGCSKGKIHILYPHEVKRIHGHRAINIASVEKVQPRIARHVVHTDRRNGVLIEAPNILAQILDLQVSM